MCEQTEVIYLEGDIVWVKLGPAWWPGEVKDFDKMEEDIKLAFKKPPIAVVKFFQEDKFEYIKNLNNIYKYNCRRKNDFIKKGLDLHRKENAFMEKFPSDVVKAEELTGGDPDILTSNMFAPEQKRNYAQLFGTPSPKKTPKIGGGRGRPSLSAQKSTPKSADRYNQRILHPRFVGKSDYEVTMLEQQTPPPVTSKYSCHICEFESSRLNVIVLHNKSHSSGHISNTNIKKPIKKRGRKATKSKFATTTSIDEDIELIRQGFLLSGSDSSDSESEQIEKSKTSAKRQKIQKTKTAPSPKKAKVSPSAICSNLLADWGDSDAEDQEETQKKQTKKSENISNALLADWDANSDEESTDLKKSDDKVKSETNENGKDSCFDFKEEEEHILQKSPGRKIPRVIPQKRKSTEIEKVNPDDNIEPDKNEESKKQKESELDDSTFKNILEETAVPELPLVESTNTPKSKENSDKEEKEAEIEDSEFKNLLDETSVPDLPSIDTLKSTQNFPMRKPIKSPDKKDENPEKTNGVLKESEAVTECPLPKKRFVRNFEDFEMLHNEHKDDIPAEQSPSKSNLEVAKLKTQLMTKLQDQTVTPPIKEKPRRGRRKSKLVEKVELIEDVETEKETKGTKEPIESIVSKDSITESHQQSTELKEENDTLNVSTPSVESSSQEKSEPIVQETESTLEKVTQIEKEATLESISKDNANEDLESISKDETMEAVSPHIEDNQLKDEEIFETQMQQNEQVIKPVEPQTFEKEEQFTPDLEQIPQEEIPPEQPPQKIILTVEEPKEKIVEEKQEAESVIEEEPPAIQHDIVQDQQIIQETTQEEQISYEEKPTELIPEQTPAQNEEDKTKMVMDISDIHIDNADNLSGLTTLAAVSELTGNFLFDPKLAETLVELPKPVEEEEMAPEEPIQQQPVEDIVASEPPKEEEIIPEQPKIEEIVPEQPKIEEIVPEQPMVEDIVAEQPAVEEITTDHPTIEEIISEHPLQEDAPIEETAIEEQPTIEETVENPEDIPLPASPKKVATLANFSMDFSDSNESLALKKDDLLQESVMQMVNEDNNISETIVTENMENEIGTAGEFPPLSFMAEESVAHEEYIEKVVPEKPGTLESEMAKLTNTQPDSEEVIQEPQNTSSSKLLEILTESRGSKKLIAPKNIIQGPNKQNIVLTSDKGLVKFNKNSKFVIKSAKTPTKSNKPIILSEKIIKPVTETETVSVKKVTSKRTYQDVEDIDTFIIQKPPKKSNSGDDMHDIILTPKSEVKQIKGRSSGTRGKPKIIEQTIIKAADIPSTETGGLLDDSIFDINSMPIVLSDQILTPESLENMPVMTDMMPAKTVACSTSSLTEKPQTIAPLKRGGTLQQIKLLNKGKISTSQIESSPKAPQTIVKGMIPRGLGKNQKVYASSTKLLKSNPAVITQPGKPGKFIILPTTTASQTTGSKYTVGKRIAMKTTQDSPTSSRMKAIQGLSNEPSGNKIMIVTNNQGVQSRVLLTPAQQKLLAAKMPTTKITKGQSQVKGNIIHPKSILTSKGTLLPVSTSQKSQIFTQAIMTSKGHIIPSQNQTLVTSEGQVLTPLTPQQLRSMKTDPKGRKMQPGQRILLPDKSLDTTPKGKFVVSSGKKTILLKGSPGQTYKKVIPGAPETKTVFMSGQKQLVSISGQQFQQAGVSGKQLVVTSKGQLIKTDKVNVSKAGEKINIQRVSKTPTRITKGKGQMILSPSMTTSPKSTIQTQSIPPLAPITTPSKKLEKIHIEPPKASPSKESAPVEQKHLIIQDNMGNQTTVTEGQILALPRETVDGQPQSYMLVTVDESGNLAPLSNEALMSLEPGLALGGDMNNLVLQIDQPGVQTDQQIETKQEVIQPEITQTEQQIVSIDGQQVILDQPQIEQQIVMSDQQIPETYEETQVVTQDMNPPEQQTLACNISTGETSQQLIITGDPESTQKFLASLSEGNTDLSSLLTGAEGNIIINTDGQQILLNTSDPDNQILLMPPSTDVGQSNIYDTQIKNQDILAAALADTDVFQPDSHEKIVSQELKTSSQLSPNSAMYPMSVGNVLETSLTLGSPIMTPLEVPSSKKVKRVVESSLLTHVPSSLELPITITDPSIAQTVSQQVLLSNELQSNLELPISISDTITSTEMSSPSFVYSLPSLEESSEMDTKTAFSENSTISSESIYSTSLTGSMSMPLLTEEPDMSHIETEIPHDEQEIPHVEQEIPLDQDLPQVHQEIPPIEQEIPHNEQDIPLVEQEIPLVEQEIPHIEQEVPNFEQEIPNVEQEIPQTEKEIPQNESEKSEISEITTDISMTEQEIVEKESEPQPTTSFAETLQSTTYTDIQDESVVEMTQKISNTLEINRIEDELDLQNNDMCDSLSEPPPGMFEKSSFLTDSYLNKEPEELDVCDIPLPETKMPVFEDSEKKDKNVDFTSEPTDSEGLPSNVELTTGQINVEVNRELPSSELSYSEVNSPRLDIDETSCEIPVQPTIVANLTDNVATDFEESRKRESEQIDESDSKRTKLCD